VPEVGAQPRLFAGLELWTMAANTVTIRTS